MDYPKALYKPGGTLQTDVGWMHYGIASDADDEAKALADGWFVTPDLAAASLALPPIDTPAEDAPPTRAELEAKATELGIKFDGRTADKTLAAKIAEALKG